MSDRIRIRYALKLPADADPRERADAIAREQTVELPRGAYREDLDARVVGRVESVEPSAEGRWDAVVSYDRFTAGDDLPQLLNLLYGNVSLLTDVGIVDVQLPEAMLEGFGGPRRGMAGLREATVTPTRPIIVGTIKPMGLSTDELASLAGTLANAGLDIIKDDQGLTNQATAPFEDRAVRCHQAVVDANVSTGGSSCYFPNVTSDPDVLAERAAFAASLGCAGVVVSPALAGLSAVRIAAEAGVMVLAHPSGTGAWLRGGGLPAPMVYGVLLRLAGADGVIYTNAGGRFPFDESTCEAINLRATAPLGRLCPSLPIAGGGIDRGKLGYWVTRYGRDVGFLVGSSLYAEPDLGAAARELMETVRRMC